jgi:hypothetical protein
MLEPIYLNHKCVIAHSTAAHIARNDIEWMVQSSHNDVLEPDGFFGPYPFRDLFRCV